MKRGGIITILLNCYIAILLLICGNEAVAAVKINEIYPEPPEGESEWVELYNDDQNVIEITNWIIQDTTSSSKEAELFKFAERTIMPPKGFCVLIFKNRLNKNGDRIRLIYENETKDCVAYGDGNGVFCNNLKDLDAPLENLTGARKPDGSGAWTSSSPTKGYSNTASTEPSEKLLCYSPTPTITPTPTLTPTPIPPVSDEPQLTPAATPPLSEFSPTPTIPPPSPTPTPAPHSYDNIYLSEVMVYPETGEYEWVEIYNDNDYTVSLKNWYLDDIENGGSAPKLFSLDIPAKGFAVVELTSSIFNNDGDQVRLLDFNRALKDSFEYIEAVKSKTLGKNSLITDEFCLQEPSKNASNNPCLNSTGTPTPTPRPSSTPTKTPPPLKTPTPTLMIINNVETQNFASLPTGNINLLGGQILGTENSNQPTISSGQATIDRKLTTYVKGFTTSSFFISLLNVFYIIHKIIKKLNNHETI